MNRAACMAWIKTASLREFLICILILGPITAIGLSTAHCYPKHWLVQWLWNTFIGLTAFDRNAVGDLVETAMYGAWIAWFIGSFGVALVLHLRLGRLRPALALLCAALAVLWLTVLGAFLGEALANGQTPFIDRQLLQRAAFVALIVWTVTSLWCARVLATASTSGRS